MADFLGGSCTSEEVLGSGVLLLPPSGGHSAIVIDTGYHARWKGVRIEENGVEER